MTRPSTQLFRILPVLCLFVLEASSQTLSLSTLRLDFGTKPTHQTDSLSLRIRNNGNTPDTVSDINTFKAAFAVRDTAFVVPAHDSVAVWVYFRTNQNVTWNDILVVETRTGHGSLSMRLVGTGTYNEALYASTQNLWENALKTALTTLVTGHTSLGYNVGRDRMFEIIDDPNNNDTVECVYSGRRIYAPNRTIAQNQGFNTEHTWPQSDFGSLEPMKSDLNHLYPTDGVPNNRRSDYPFGPVANVTWQDGGSKLGTRSTGEIVFEPRDSHKGDVARALFYFLLRYTTNYGGFMTPTQESDLRVWHKADPVGTKEILRNNAVASFQTKRNPLIDHPEFVDRITQFHTGTAPTLFPAIAASPAAVAFGEIAVGDSSEFNLLLVNAGRGTLSIASVALQTSSSSFSILSAPSSVPPDSSGFIRVWFRPTVANQTYGNAIVVSSNDRNQGTLLVPIAGRGVAKTAATTASVKFLLEGPYDPSLGVMSAVLNAGGILASRFGGRPIPSTAIDSVSIEVRDSLSGSSSTNRDSAPAWLLSDGTIRSFSDTTKSFVSLSAPPGDYYLVLHHRNHLSVMSSSALFLDAAAPSMYDFTTSQSQAYGTNALKEIGAKFLMYAGDANQSAVVTATDANEVFGSLNSTGYERNDVNLSGVVTASDANSIFQNLNVGAQVP